MREFPYDNDRIYKSCYLYVKSKYENMSEEWYQRKAVEDMSDVKLDILKANLLFTIIEQSPHCDKTLAEKKAFKIVNALPKELYQNLEEWIDGKPISEIKYGDISIKEIMETYKKMGRYVSFIDCCEAMIQYIENGCKNKGICYHLYEVM